MARKLPIKFRFAGRFLGLSKREDSFTQSSLYDSNEVIIFPIVQSGSFPYRFLQLGKDEDIVTMATKKQLSLCPIKYLVTVFGGKWKLPAVCIIANCAPVRYGQIKRELGSITNMMLSKTLKELEKDGVICRKQYNEVPPHVEYTLSEAGKTILPVLSEMGKWATSQMKKKNIMSGCTSCSANPQRTH